VSFILSVSIKPLILSVVKLSFVILNVVMLNVVAPPNEPSVKSFHWYRSCDKTPLDLFSSRFTVARQTNNGGQGQLL
jgi:hypothetical protein